MAVEGKVYAECTVNIPADQHKFGLKNSSKTHLQTYDGTEYPNAGDVLAIAVDSSDGSYQFYKNGTPVNVGVGTVGTTDGIYIGGDNKAADNGLAFNFGQQDWVYGPPAGYEGLYQEWSEYARSTIGYALDRVAELERLRLEDAATIAALRSDLTGALNRIASIESDEVNDDAVDNSLITLVGSLSSQITTWQTRIETAEAALTAAVERITTLEGN